MYQLTNKEALIANLIGVGIGLAIIGYADTVTGNSKNHRQIAEQAQGSTLSRLYASCSSSAPPVPLMRGNRYVWSIVNGKSIIAETNSPDNPIQLSDKSGILGKLGYHTFLIRFGEGPSISGNILCLPRNPFRG